MGGEGKGRTRGAWAEGPQARSRRGSVRLRPSEEAGEGAAGSRAAWGPSGCLGAPGLSPQPRPPAGDRGSEGGFQEGEARGATIVPGGARPRDSLLTCPRLPRLFTIYLAPSPRPAGSQPAKRRRTGVTPAAGLGPQLRPGPQCFLRSPQPAATAGGSCGLGLLSRSLGWGAALGAQGAPGRPGTLAPRKSAGWGDAATSQLLSVSRGSQAVPTKVSPGLHLQRTVRWEMWPHTPIPLTSFSTHSWRSLLEIISPDCSYWRTPGSSRINLPRSSTCVYFPKREERIFSAQPRTRRVKSLNHSVCVGEFGSRWEQGRAEHGDAQAARSAAVADRARGDQKEGGSPLSEKGLRLPLIKVLLPSPTRHFSLESE
ncbi:collagen alpha-1(III) chain-like [Rattus norvegicus]|uniref:collagen alpha-1(III) chain-like n=1 Tax=Rattus norvegicus TaxID=10116 RepID=UPI001916DF01|nr:collagen alpha-1(III) chain-like [Rattus norvegicus]